MLIVPDLELSTRKRFYYDENFSFKAETFNACFLMRISFRILRKSFGEVCTYFMYLIISLDLEGRMNYSGINPGGKEARRNSTSNQRGIYIYAYLNART